MNAILAVVVVAAIVTVVVPKTQGAGNPVVLELFTSQGCTSCPPADELLRKLAKDRNLQVIPLAYHVDYWDYLGWRDPFSSSLWSERQLDYVRAMKLDGPFTPQLVINGSRQLVGSNTAQILSAIAEESKRQPEAQMSLTVKDQEVIVNVESEKPAELIVVAYENGITTTITRGENRGRTQTDDAIVRRLVRSGAVKGEVEKRVRLKLTNTMRVAAFLQDRSTRRILAAASQP